MKLLIASDLHGSAYYTKKLIDVYRNSGAEKLVLLGDLLYHGPRNDLPEEYAPKTVISMLNELKDEIICVRGNCDTEVDQMVLEFPILSDYAWIFDGNIKMFLTHGHVYNKENLPKLSSGDVLLNGHFHVTENTEINGIRYINPGSVSIPKENTKHSCILYENGNFEFVEL